MHKSFIVVVVIGLSCFNLSIKLRLILYEFINLYVDIFFSFNVLYNGAYVINYFHLNNIIIYALPIDNCLYIEYTCIKY